MAFITKTYLPRRTFLRGMGVTLALPLLDSMVPAATPLVKTAALPKSRFCGIYVPHGATMDKWTPATEGAGFAFTDTLKPLEKLRATPDGDGNLLDHSVVLYGSSMSNGNQHDHDPLPILVAGGASGQMKGDRHLMFAEHTPMSNLMLSLLDKLGVRQDGFGDSTGKLEI